MVEMIGKFFFFLGGGGGGGVWTRSGHLFVGYAQWTMGGGEPFAVSLPALTLPPNTPRGNQQPKSPKAQNAPDGVDRVVDVDDLVVLEAAHEVEDAVHGRDVREEGVAQPRAWFGIVLLLGLEIPPMMMMYVCRSVA